MKEARNCPIHGDRSEKTIAILEIDDGHRLQNREGIRKYPNGLCVMYLRCVRIAQVVDMSSLGARSVLRLERNE